MSFKMKYIIAIAPVTALLLRYIIGRMPLFVNHRISIIYIFTRLFVLNRYFFSYISRIS